MLDAVEISRYLEWPSVLQPKHRFTPSVISKALSRIILLNTPTFFWTMVFKYVDHSSKIFTNWMKFEGNKFHLPQELPLNLQLELATLG